MVSSGTEATMSAIRLARGYTRSRQASSSSKAVITATPIRCWSRRDPARSRSACRRRPACRRNSPPTRSRCRTTTAHRSAPRSRELGAQIACVIVEPVAGNMNCIPPAPGFLETLRERVHAARRGADLRRSHDRVSRGARRRAGALRDRVRTSRRSARSSAAACRSARSAVAARSCSTSRRSDRCTRPARCREIRSRWPPGSRRCDGSTAPGFLRATRAHDRTAGAGPARRGALGAGVAAGDESRLRHVRSLLHRRARSDELRGGDALRRRALQALLPRHAR